MAWRRKEGRRITGQSRETSNRGKFNGHAILTVKSGKGELILDNLTDDIRAWAQSGYTFVKRQSQENPNIWLSLGNVVGSQMSER